MRIDEMTSPAFAAAVKENPWTILPLGATESHGPHLPLGTDTFQPEYIASEVVRRGGKVLIAPTLPYGLHSTTRNVPGTIDISFDTLRSLTMDILVSLIQNGLRRIMIISGHAGSLHMAAVTEACRRVIEKNKDVEIQLFSDFYIAERCDSGAKKGDGHGGFMETSRILHIRPDTVTADRPSGRYTDVGYRVLSDPREKMPNGVVGDTADASAEAGKKINEFIIEEILRMIA